MNEPSTSAEETHISSHNDSSASSRDQLEKSEIGDIVWAKIGKFPFWPSIVCNDPKMNIYIKKSLKNKFSLHVRFCNDNGRRSWARMLESYSGKADLFSKYPNCLDYIKDNKKQMEAWRLAVIEADNLLKFNREERWVKFRNLNNLDETPPNSLCKSNQSTSASNNSVSGTAKRKINTDDSSHQNGTHRYINTKNIEIKKKLKKNTKKKKEINPRKVDTTFSTPLSISESNFSISDVANIPGTARRKIDENIRIAVEKLEEKQTRQLIKWRAVQLAKTNSIAFKKRKKN